MRGTSYESWGLLKDHSSNKIVKSPLHSHPGRFICPQGAAVSVWTSVSLTTNIHNSFIHPVYFQGKNHHCNIHTIL